MVDSKMKPKLKRTLVIFFIIYCMLWATTAIWGRKDVDKLFDQQFAYGYTGWSVRLDGRPNDTSLRKLIERVEWFNVKDPNDPKNSAFIKDKKDFFFRYRSPGIAIAPFLIVDDTAALWGHLGGFGATRLNFWFFGYTHWWRIKSYWDA